MNTEDILREAYAKFNARDIHGVIALMHPDVEWPNAWEGGWWKGRAAVRDYWTRQWAAIDPHVEPVRFEEPAGAETIRVRRRPDRAGSAGQRHCRQPRAARLLLRRDPHPLNGSRGRLVRLVPRGWRQSLSTTHSNAAVMRYRSAQPQQHVCPAFATPQGALLRYTVSPSATNPDRTPVRGTSVEPNILDQIFVGISRFWQEGVVDQYRLWHLNVHGIEVTQSIQHYRADEHSTDPADRGMDNSLSSWRTSRRSFASTCVRGCSARCQT